MQIVSEKERKIKMDKKEFALNQHEKWNGKIEVISRAKIETPEDLAVAYTPGVAEPCLKIAKDVDLSYKYTRRGNLVAVVTDGTAVLGLGDIGPEAGMPVMEGKCALFKEFGDVDAFPLCIRSKDVDEIVNTVALLAGSFGGINLEDISAPRCYEKVRKLSDEDKKFIPMFVLLRRITRLAWLATHSDSDTAKTVDDEYLDVTIDMAKEWLKANTRVAVITGAAGGIGYGIAKKFLESCK